MLKVGRQCADLLWVHMDYLSGSSRKTWMDINCVQQEFLDQTGRQQRCWHLLRTTSLTSKKPIQIWERASSRVTLAEWSSQNGERWQPKDVCTRAKVCRKWVEKGEGGICKEVHMMLELGWGFRYGGEEMEDESTAYHMSYWNYHICLWYLFWTINMKTVTLGCH